MDSKILKLIINLEKEKAGLIFTPGNTELIPKTLR